MRNPRTHHVPGTAPEFSREARAFFSETPEFAAGTPGPARRRHHHSPMGPGGMPGPMGGGRGRGRGHHGGPGGRRAGRGDVRAAVLLLLDAEPMHGYQLIQAITDRTNGSWKPSPGAIYPTLAQLEDEGLVTIEASGGRKLARLTEAGQQEAAAQAEANDPFADFAAGNSGPDLRALLHELAGAARQVGMAGTPEQVTAAAALLAETKRSLYLILAGETPAAAPAADPAADQD
ncbi:DNA-binding PadR family transcriptional regulator [Arthrobacter sp. UYP6]|uniref:PadR family transcriptional regulator n=1 Tax=Arthrobacter sp. UYP6 TaxID=1756378 RepID=UPI00339AF286